jgi:hypothetical protein
MKKLLLTFALLTLGGMAFAATSVWKSSYTATADTAKVLCPNTHKAILHGVCVERADAGTFSIYDASSTAVNPIAVLTSTAAIAGGCQFYDVIASSGLVYSNSAANPTVILYDCF